MMPTRSQLEIPTRPVGRNRPRRIVREPPLPPPLPPIREEITPSVWIQDSNSHYLIGLELPDFKQEDIQMKIEGTDRVNISGERKGGEKIIFVDKTYIVPENADVERTSFKLDGGTFTVTVPKRLPPPPPPLPVQEPVQSTDKDAKTLTDIGDLRKESDGEDEKLKDQAQQQNEKEKDADDLKKESEGEEDEKQLKDQEQQQQKREKGADDLKKESDGEEDEKQFKDQDQSDHGDQDEKLKDQEQQKQQQEKESKSTSAEKEEEEIEQKRGSSSDKNQFNSATQMICKSKNTIFISLIAFCLGVLVSQKMGH